MEVVDEAYFSTGNMPQAMEDYKNKEAYLKRFGLEIVTFFVSEIIVD